MRITKCRTWNKAKKKTMKNWKMRHTHTVGPRIWRETVKNMKNEKCTIQDLDYGQKTLKGGK